MNVVKATIIQIIPAPPGLYLDEYNAALALALVEMTVEYEDGLHTGREIMGVGTDGSLFCAWNVYYADVYYLAHALGDYDRTEMHFGHEDDFKPIGFDLGEQP